MGQNETSLTLAYEGGVTPQMSDGPYMVIVEHESTGSLYFGPFRSYEKAEKLVERIERRTPEAQWSIEVIQPGSYAAEWLRIIKENVDE